MSSVHADVDLDYTVPFDTWGVRGPTNTYRHAGGRSRSLSTDVALVTMS